MKKIIFTLIFLIIVINIEVNIIETSNSQSRFETEESYEVFNASDLRDMKVCNSFKLDESPPNSKELYKSYKYQFELQLPINEKWSTKAHRLSLFENIHVNDSNIIHAIEFGALVNTKKLKCQRTHKLLITQKRPFDNVMNKSQDNSENSEVIELNNNIKSVYSHQGKCNEATLEIIGAKYNIVLISRCHQISEFPKLPDIVNEFKFFEY